jgi:bacterioferritin-associated ferredoxin
VYPCHCRAITDRSVDATIASDARTVADVTALCRAGGGCGRYHDLIQVLIDATSCFSAPTSVFAA